VVLDGIEYLGQVDSDSLGLHHQLLHLAVEQPLLIAGTRCRRLGNNRADARANLEKAFMDQVLDNFMRRVGVNLQVGGQRADGREWLSRQEFAADEGLRGGVNHLIEDRLARPECHLEYCHIRNVTRVTPRVNSNFVGDRA